MKKLKWPGATLMMPVPPTLVSCGTMEKPNAITIAWTGIINSQPPQTYISIRPERYSYNVIKESGEFVINMATVDLLKAVDYCGCRSGKDENKLKAMRLTPIPCEGMSCPQIAESPVALTCKVTKVVSLGSHDMFIADITGVLVDEDLLDKKGKLQIENAGLIAYAHGQYFELGKKIGSMGFSVSKIKQRTSDDNLKRNETRNKPMKSHINTKKTDRNETAQETANGNPAAIKPFTPKSAQNKTFGAKASGSAAFGGKSSTGKPAAGRSFMNKNITGRSGKK